MIANPENERRYGLSVAHGIGIIVACALFVMALLALLPDG